MLTLDTSALYAIFKPEDAHHARVLAARDADAGPYFVPAGILGEIGWMVGATLALSTLIALLQDLDSGAYNLDCGERDFRRMQALVTRYDDLPLGLADASVGMVIPPSLP